MRVFVRRYLAGKSAFQPETSRRPGRRVILCGPTSRPPSLPRNPTNGGFRPLVSPALFLFYSLPQATRIETGCAPRCRGESTRYSHRQIVTTREICKRSVRAAPRAFSCPVFSLVRYRPEDLRPSQYQHARLPIPDEQQDVAVKDRSFCKWVLHPLVLHYYALVCLGGPQRECHDSARSPIPHRHPTNRRTGPGWARRSISRPKAMSRCDDHMVSRSTKP